MPRLVQDEEGSYFVDTGGGVYQPVTPRQAKVFLENPDMGSAAWSAVEHGTMGLLSGAMSLLNDNPVSRQQVQTNNDAAEALMLQQPVAAFLGQFAPQVALGAATAGSGALATVATEGALGAAASPDAPVTGAALGAGLAALPFAAAPVGRYAAKQASNLPGMENLPNVFNRAAREAEREALRTPGGVRPGDGTPAANRAVLDDAALSSVEAEAAGQAMPGARAAMTADELSAASQARATPPASMRDRVLQNLEQAEPSIAPRRVLEGTMEADELAQYGVQTTKAQRAILSAKAGTEDYAKAVDALRLEEGLISNPMLGSGIRRARDMQREAATGFVARELGVPHGVGLTDSVLADVFQQTGQGLDDMAARMGGVEISADIRKALGDIVENATGDHQALIRRITDEVMTRADRNGGMLTGQDWQLTRSRLVKAADTAQRQGDFGKLSDTRDIMDTLTDAMESNLDPASARELADLRRRYAVAMTASKTGVRDEFGQINPLSFRNNWRKGQSKKRWGKDEVGQFMNTMAALNRKVIPDSGTAFRALYQGGTEALTRIPFAGPVLKTFTYPVR